MGAETTRPQRDEFITTRERILREASHQFAARGYYGSSTRDIATAVGIRQPSLFHHFPNKQAIFQELLSYSLDDSALVAGYLVGADGTPAARLYRFLVEDFRYLMDSPYDLRSIFNSDVLLDEEFKPWEQTASELHVAVADIIRQGIEAGEFIEIEVSFARQAISGLMLETIRERSLGEELPAQRPTRTADFVLRALLVDPRRIETIATEAFAIDGLPTYRDTV
ncbi:MAG: TetR/AcrR family transcriptional regulator [Actinomycetota bacterium]|nr:TetR/AcrR family transcriptional regulator [Actinomycetota bacterium]